MTRPDVQRVIAVSVGPAPGLPDELVAAMLSDVVDLVASTPQVAPAVLATHGCLDLARDALWPSTPLIEVADDATIGGLLAAVPSAGMVAVAVVAADAPDLPGLLLGKLFRAVSGRTDVAVIPADPDALVAVAATLPQPDWLRDSDVRLGDRDALLALHAAAPPRELSLAPGWHRVRSVADTDTLDPGLEGWDATRLALGR
jgi:molybdopterin-guanine dinucleotide biosynthesis protein A